MPSIVIALFNELIEIAPMQAQINVPRMVNPAQIRAPNGATIIQQRPPNVQIQSHPPALHPVSQNTFAPGGAQVSKSNPIKLTNKQQSVPCGF